jgi:hypothetical protein
MNKGHVQLRFLAWQRLTYSVSKFYAVCGWGMRHNGWGIRIAATVYPCLTKWNRITGVYASLSSSRWGGLNHPRLAFPTPFPVLVPRKTKHINLVAKNDDQYFYTKLKRNTLVINDSPMYWKYGGLNTLSKYYVYAWIQIRIIIYL